MLTPRPRCTVLIVDDEPAVLALMAGQLRPDYEVETAATAAEARAIFAKRPVDIVLTDLQLPDSSGLQLLEWVQKHHPRTARLLLAGTARLEDAADAINCGRIHKLVLKPWRGDDLTVMMRSVAHALLLERSHEHLVEQLQRSHAELEKRVQERTREVEDALNQLQIRNQILERMALTDPLTRLPNRRAIELVARREILRRARFPTPLAFGLVDVDWFKDINEHHTLSGGDHVLGWLAQVLQANVRGTDALGRVGGEEFMVVAPATDLAGAEILAERLRGGVEQAATSFAGRPIAITVSVGFAAAPPRRGADLLRPAPRHRAVPQGRQDRRAQPLRRPPPPLAPAPRAGYTRTAPAPQSRTDAVKLPLRILALAIVAIAALVAPRAGADDPKPAPKPVEKSPFPGVWERESDSGAKIAIRFKTAELMQIKVTVGDTEAKLTFKYKLEGDKKRVVAEATDVEKKGDMPNVPAKGYKMSFLFKIDPKKDSAELSDFDAENKDDVRDIVEGMYKALKAD